MSCMLKDTVRCLVIEDITNYINLIIERLKINYHRIQCWQERMLQRCIEKTIGHVTSVQQVLNWRPTERRHEGRHEKVWTNELDTVRHKMGRTQNANKWNLMRKVFIQHSMVKV